MPKKSNQWYKQKRQDFSQEMREIIKIIVVVIYKEQEEEM